uniref:GPI mannosyltransferase 2 n=1 Tax=Toxoplasma gondii TaxID=5811 RepID=Q53HW9_TOXGO|nr:phosphatidylinositol glycan class V [Toxoplasma gondii]
MGGNEETVSEFWRPPRVIWGFTGIACLFLRWDGEYFLTFALQKTAYYFELTHAFFPGLSVVYIHLGGFLRRLLSRAAEVADSAVPRSSSRFSASQSEESEESRSSKGFQSSPPLQDSFPFPARIDDAVVFGFAAVLVSNLAFALARDPQKLHRAYVERRLRAASWKREGEDVYVIEEERNRQMPSVERVRDENEESCRIAFLAAGWFSFSAANIHMSAAYTESLFAALTMWGLYMLLFAEHPPAGSPQSFDCLDTPEEAPQDGKDMPKASPGPSDAQNLGNKERVISNAASPMPPWCSARVPNIYPWIQREYWDVYFLGFFRFKNLYLIILALPFYFLAMSCILFFLRRTWGPGRCAETLSDDAVNQGREATGELLEGEKPRHSLRGMQGSKNFNLRWSKNVTSLWRQGGRFCLSVVLDPAFGEICQLAFLMMFMFLCGNTNHRITNSFSEYGAST